MSSGRAPDTAHQSLVGRRCCAAAAALPDLHRDHVVSWLGGAQQERVADQGAVRSTTSCATSDSTGSVLARLFAADGPQQEAAPDRTDRRQLPGANRRLVAAASAGRPDVGEVVSGRAGSSSCTRWPFDPRSRATPRDRRRLLEVAAPTTSAAPRSSPTRCPRRALAARHGGAGLRLRAASPRRPRVRAVRGAAALRERPDGLGLIQRLMPRS